MTNTQILQQQGVDFLHSACNSYGILASPDKQDNYQRIWSRDSMIAGIAGLLAGDDKIIAAWRESILTLAAHQHKYGIIPSNVLPHQDKNSEISYGSLAGRVDATSWFVIGACLYLINQDDQDLKSRLRTKLSKALSLLDHWEFNGNGLVYTPLSGNWADEYPIQGHTLYDNLLRIWGMHMFGTIYDEPELLSRYEALKEKITLNFWPETSKSDHPKIYHQRAFDTKAKEGILHFPCSVSPSGYDMHFDAAGHAMAYLLNLVNDQQHESINTFLKQNIFKRIGANLIPAFWPVIERKDPKWKMLSNNYSYSFKNEPHHFHNGGIWPVWMGLYGLGYARKNSDTLAKEMIEAWLNVENNNISFAEYISSDELNPSGKRKLSFSASGLIFLTSAVSGNAHQKLHLPS